MGERYAFRMRLNPGQEGEYRRRHDAIWPELEALLREAGVSDYSIWLDPESGHLIGMLTRADDHAMEDLKHHPIMRRWWAHMTDIMETHADDEPVSVPLTRVFHMD